MGYKQSCNQLPRRSEYFCGGYNGLEHIVVNYHSDGTVTRTINGIEEYYDSGESFQQSCEIAYQDYLKFLDNWKPKKLFDFPFKIGIMIFDRFRNFVIPRNQS